MTDLRADALSPIDAATLWPQMNRLSTEVIATRSGESLLVSSGLAATGLSHLPRLPRTIVLGVRPGLRYRGVLVAEQLEGGAAWQIDSIRIARETDSEAITTLLDTIGGEVARLRGRTIFLRHEEGSPHQPAIHRGGFRPYVREQLYALPPSARRREPQTAFREATSADRIPVFRLYCRAVPEAVRRYEAPTEEAWHAARDGFGCGHEYVRESDGELVAWLGLGEREAHLLTTSNDTAIVEDAFALAEATLGRRGALVVAEFQESLAHAATDAGFTPLGVRVVCARRLAVTQALAERATVPEAAISP